MDWKPDRQAKKAIYKQLAEFIEKGIADGTFPPGKQKRGYLCIWVDDGF
ncbi:hypothetical protein [Bacillus litorisediminis]|nr:hypothetical protein [Bacillus litorisediminis]